MLHRLGRKYNSRCFWMDSGTSLPNFTKFHQSQPKLRKKNFVAVWSNTLVDERYAVFELKPYYCPIISSDLSLIFTSALVDGANMTRRLITNKQNDHLKCELRHVCMRCARVETDNIVRQELIELRLITQYDVCLYYRMAWVDIGIYYECKTGFCVRIKYDRQTSDTMPTGVRHGARQQNASASSTMLHECNQP